MGKTYSGTYTNGITLTNFSVDNPVAVTGVIDTKSGDALLGRADRWTVTNTGTIVSAAAVGVRLTAGGTVTNRGSIAGTSGVLIGGGGGSVSNGGAITGTAGQGVAVSGGNGTVTNAGSISGTASGVLLQGGAGTLANTGSIDGVGNAGILVKFGTGNVTNDGAIGGANGIRLLTGGTVTNDAAGSIDGRTGNGVFIGGGRGTVSNAGTIGGAGTGIRIDGGAGSVENGGAIGGASGIVMRTGGMVVNAAGGSITGTAGQGVAISGGNGTLINTGSIGGTARGVLLQGGVGTIVNSGSIDGAGNAGIVVKYGTGQVTNAGTVDGANGVFLRAGGTVANDAGGSIGGTNGAGVYMNGGGTVTNAGSIIGNHTAGDSDTRGIGVWLKTGGSIANGNSGSIAGTGDGSWGVYLEAGGNVETSRAGYSLAGPGSVANDGTISGGSGVLLFGFRADLENEGEIDGTALAGIAVLGSGSVNNDVSGSIAGHDAGILVVADPRGAATTLTNLGIITGGIGLDARRDFDSVTVVNSGTITGTDGRAVVFGAGNDLLVVNPGAAFRGIVDGGGGTDQAVFTVPGTLDIGNFIGFETYRLADDGATTLTVTAANFVHVSGSVITIYAGNGRDTIDAASLPGGDSVTIHAGSGRDMLTGGAGNDVFFAGGNTWMMGARGANEFVFVAPGHNRILDFAISHRNGIVFSNSGFDLDLRNATATPQPLPSSLFVENLTGHFTSRTQRFAYSLLTGDLFYSAHGTNQTRELVAELAGQPFHPHIGASQLYFIS